jgi:hypothetical protein
MLLMFSFAANNLALADGGGSTGGGGPVVFQAKAIQAILDSNEFLFMFSKPGAIFIKSIEHLSWANGVTHYRVNTDGGCSIEVTTTADESGTQYEVGLGEMVCSE